MLVSISVLRLIQYVAMFLWHMMFSFLLIVQKNDGSVLSVISGHGKRAAFSINPSLPPHNKRSGDYGTTTLGYNSSI